jgi:hypothetical protein
MGLQEFHRHVALAHRTPFGTNDAVERRFSVRPGFSEFAPLQLDLLLVGQVRDLDVGDLSDTRAGGHLREALRKAN